MQGNVYRVGETVVALFKRDGNSALGIIRMVGEFTATGGSYLVRIGGNEDITLKSSEIISLSELKLRVAAYGVDYVAHHIKVSPSEVSRWTNSI